MQHNNTSQRSDYRWDAIAAGLCITAAATVLARQSCHRPTLASTRSSQNTTARRPAARLRVSRKGAIVAEKAYGMADLEHDVAIRPDTIFEAGSVSKQFTAAAILLLARDGKLSLDDPARKYIPELPDYGAPLTIRHMLTHTSGLRDWGNVASIAGWPRGTRVHTHAHVLDIISRQRVAELSIGHALLLLQHRLQPRRDHRLARERAVVHRVHAARGSSSRSA